MIGYPFAFSKNSHGLNWRPVLYPDFISDREARSIVLEAQKDDRLEANEAVYVQATHSKFGTLDIIFWQDQEVREDSTGRNFKVYEGLIFRGRFPRYNFCEEHFEAAHALMLPKLEEFWEANDWPDSKVESRLSLDLDEIEGAAPVRLAHRKHQARAEQGHADKSKGEIPVKRLREPTGGIPTGEIRKRSRAEASFTPRPTRGTRQVNASLTPQQDKEPNEAPSLRTAQICIATGCAAWAIALLGPPWLRLPSGVIGAGLLGYGAVEIATHIRGRK